MKSAATQKRNSGPTWEVKPPKLILERLASAFTARGLDHNRVPGHAFDAPLPADFAAAASYAAEEYPIGWLAFWAKWLGCRRSQIELAAQIAVAGHGHAPFKHIPRLAGLAAMEYCHGPFNQRRICGILRISRSRTWPKLRGAYDRMLQEAHQQEAYFGRELKRSLRG